MKKYFNYDFFRKDIYHNSNIMELIYPKNGSNEYTIIIKTNDNSLIKSLKIKFTEMFGENINWFIGMNFNGRKKYGIIIEESRSEHVYHKCMLISKELKINLLAESSQDTIQSKRTISNFLKLIFYY